MYINNVILCNYVFPYFFNENNENKYIIILPNFLNNFLNYLSRITFVISQSPE